MLLHINLIAKWELKEFPHYKWTECKRLVNSKTGKICKKQTNGRGTKPGYYINRKFIKIEDLIANKCLQLIAKNDSPF